MAEGSTAAAKPRLSVVVVTYNSREVIADCLAAVDAGADNDIQLIVVDNASSDGTAKYVEERFPFAAVVRSEVNSGFAGGVRQGVKLAKGRAIGLLNPDAVANRTVLLELVSRLDADEKLGAVAPLIKQPSGRLRIASAGRMPTVRRMFTHYSGLSRLGGVFPSLEGHYLLPSQVMSERDVDWVTGACVVMPSLAWSRVGGLSTRWFMYAEDIELCWRMWRNGYRVRVFPDLVVTHLVGASAAGHQSKTNSAWITNLYDFYSLNLSHGAVERLAWRLVVGVGLLSRAAIYFVLALGRRGPWRMESSRFVSYALSVFRAG